MYGCDVCGSFYSSSAMFSPHTQSIPPPERLLTRGASGPYFLFPALLTDLDLLKELEVTSPEQLECSQCRDRELLYTLAGCSRFCLPFTFHMFLQSIHMILQAAHMLLPIIHMILPAAHMSLQSIHMILQAAHMLPPTTRMILLATNMFPQSSHMILLAAHMLLILAFPHIYCSDSIVLNW